MASVKLSKRSEKIIELLFGEVVRLETKFWDAKDRLQNENFFTTSSKHRIIELTRKGEISLNPEKEIKFSREQNKKIRKLLRERDQRFKEIKLFRKTARGILIQK